MTETPRHGYHQHGRLGGSRRRQEARSVCALRDFSSAPIRLPGPGQRLLPGGQQLNHFYFFAKLLSNILITQLTVFNEALTVFNEALTVFNEALKSHFA